VVACVFTFGPMLGAPALAQGQAHLLLSSSGLPKNLEASIAIAGEAVNRRVRFSGTRGVDLAPGSYSVLVKAVTARHSRRGVRRGAVAYPERKRIRVTVRNGAASKLEIRYRAVVNPGVKPLPPRVLRIVGDPGDPSAIVLPAGTGTPPAGTIYTTAPSSRLPRGLISAVTSAKKKSNGTRVTLKAVPPSEAVPSLEFNGKLELEPVPGAVQASASKDSCSPPKLLKFGAHLNSFELRRASIGTWPPQMRLTLAIRTTESLGVAAVAAGINCDWTLTELGPYQGAIPVGPVVIPVYATVPVRAGAHINGRFDVGTLNVASTTVADVAAGFEENRASLSQQGSNVWTSGALSLSGSAKLYASVGVQAGIGVAKGGNVHVSAGFGPEFDWSSGHPCEVYLDLGTLSAGVSVFGKNLNTPGFTPIKPRLWSGCGQSDGPKPGGGGGGGSSGGGGDFGGGESGGGSFTTVYHTSAEGPYTGSTPEPNKPESPRLSVGYHYGCAIAVSNAVRCFGGNLDFFNATSVPGEFQQVSVGSVFSCGVRTDSELACWGWVRPGEPTTETGPPPSGSFRSVGVGLIHVCAVDTQYVLACWGKEDNAAVIPDPGRYTQVSAGWEYTCGLHTDGTLDCWGEDTPFGGNVTTAPAGTYREVSVGEEEACALTYFDDVTCWSIHSNEIKTHAGPFTEVDAGEGWACAKQADGTPTCFVPVSTYNPYFTFPPRPGSYSDLSLGGPGVCGRRDDGSVNCWAGAYAGQVTPAPGSFTKLMAAGHYTCGLRSDQSVACWGNTDGEAPSQLAGSFLQISGSGWLDSYEPLCGIRTDHTLTCHDGSTPLPGSFAAIAVTEFDGCAIAAGSGAVSCWPNGIDAVPTPPAGAFTQISGNGFWSRYCGLRTDHTIACWQNPESQIPLAPPPGGQFTTVDVGAYQTDCGIRTDGTLSCWKPASYLGPVSPPAGTFVDVAVAGQAACAIRASGSIACWGRNDYGEAIPPGGTFTQIVAGATHMCALRSDGTVACWGHGDVLPAG
jgi:hypothetical protein